MDTVTVATTAGSSEDLSLIVSIISILFTGFTFWFYDRKLKKQQRKLNNQQELLNTFIIKKHKEEEQEKKKAYIEVNIVDGFKAGNKTLKIYNKGNSTANNIRMDLIGNYPNIFIDYDSLFPYNKLNKSQGFDIKFSIFKYVGERATTIKLKFMWDDEFAKDNIEEYELPV